MSIIARLVRQANVNNTTTVYIAFLYMHVFVNKSRSAI